MKNEVYVLTQTNIWHYEGDEVLVIGVYSSYDKANTVQKTLKKPQGYDEVRWDIELFIIDE